MKIHPQKNLRTKKMIKQYSSFGDVAVAANGFGLYARWRFKALTFNIAPMMIEAQMFNLLLHRHWRKTRVTGWCGLVAQTFNYAE